MRLVVYLLVSSLSVYIASYIVPGISIENPLTIFIVAVVLGALNTFVKPILLFLTLPATIISLGLFIFILNALIVLFASWIVPGFHVDGFLTALLFSIVVSLVSWFLNSFTK
jgi:putative membrane protein